MSMEVADMQLATLGACIRTGAAHRAWQGHNSGAKGYNFYRLLMGSIDQLSVAQLERLIRTKSLVDADVWLTHHATTRMRQRHIARAEVFEVLRLGRLVGVPEPNVSKGSLECRMQRYVAGRELAVVAAMTADNSGVIVVTVIDLGA